jgi:transposase
MPKNTYSLFHRNLDPGIRNFLTFFSDNSFGWLGENANLRIQKLCFKLDKLISKISKAKSRQKKRLKEVFPVPCSLFQTGYLA